MEKGHVYTVEDFPKSVEALKAYLGKPLAYWVADKATLGVGLGMPSDWKEQGALFGPMGEIRWWREGNTYKALLLTEAAVEGLPAVSGEWTHEKKTVNLQDLSEPRVNPPFTQYPHGAPKGRLKVRVYYRDGIPVFVSPRRFESAEGEKA